MQGIAELREARTEPMIEGGGYESGRNFAFRMITYRMKEAHCTTGCNVQRLIPAHEHYDPITGLALQRAVPVNLAPLAHHPG